MSDNKTESQLFRDIQNRSDELFNNYVRDIVQLCEIADLSSINISQIITSSVMPTILKILVSHRVDEELFIAGLRRMLAEEVEHYKEFRARMNEMRRKNQ